MKGFELLKKQLRDLTDGFDDVICNDILLEVGAFLRDKARGNLPSHWLLTESLGYDVDAANSGVKVGPRYGFETEIGDPAQYGIYHEFGLASSRVDTIDGKRYYQHPVPARHYLQRAIDEGREEVLNIISTKMNEYIEGK